MNNILLRNQSGLRQAITGFRVFNPGQQSLQSSLRRFSPIHLDQLGRAALMDRQETKYIFHEEQILNLLPELETDYRVLEIKGLRICNYRTIYFDTSEFLFFQQQQIGSGQRWKIRQRTYLDSRANFLEVKFKDNRKRTRKNRIETEFNPNHILDNEKAFLSANAPFSQEELDPKLEVSHTRTTLVNNDGMERVTLDSQLYFSDGKNNRDLDGLMIAEIKQTAYKPTSPFMARIKMDGVRPSPFSKYCIGLILLYPEIKHNRFKPILHHVSKLLGGDITNERTQ